jgi:hypothetical protein
MMGVIFRTRMKVYTDDVTLHLQGWPKFVIGVEDMLVPHLVVELHCNVIRFRFSGTAVPDNFHQSWKHQGNVVQ